jgi:hypothetical protein
MNIHILFDNITALLGGLIAGRKKFFAGSIQGTSFEEHVANLKIVKKSLFTFKMQVTC